MFFTIPFILGFGFIKHERFKRTTEQEEEEITRKNEDLFEATDSTRELFFFTGNDFGVLDAAVAGDRDQGVGSVERFDLLRKFAGMRF